MVNSFYQSEWLILTRLDSALRSLTQPDSAWLSLTQPDSAWLSSESVNIIERMNHSTYTQVYQVFLFEESWIKRQKWYIFQLQFLPKKLANLWLQTTFININIEQQNKNYLATFSPALEYGPKQKFSRHFTCYMVFPKVGWKKLSHGW